MASPITSLPISENDLSDALAAQQRVLVPSTEVDMTFSYRSAISNLSPSPIIISQAVFGQMASIHSAIDKAVNALVKQWPEDPQLQELISVPPRIVPLLQPREGYPPYRPGTIRPDVLFDTDGDLRVCEINARFPLNGYLMVSKLAEGLFNECLNPRSLMARLNMSPLGPQLDFIPALRTRLVPDDSNPVVFHLRSGEPMHDSAMLEKSLKITVRHAPPASLAVGPSPHKKLCLREPDGSLTHITALLLELHQEEVLALPDDVLDALGDLSHAGRTLNDLRTVFLAHDKSFLHVITHDLLTGLDETTRSVLHRHVIPTIRLDSKTATDASFGDGTTRVVKPALSGKGNGIVMEKNIGTDDFNLYLSKLPKEKPFIMQPYIKQLTLETKNLSGDTRFLPAVGILSGLDGDFYGPGIFRCSDTDVVSICGGGFPVIPATRLIDMPPSCKFLCKSLDMADSVAINAELRKHGIALVGTSEKLAAKQNLERFLTDGLGAQCRTHSDTQGAVWDVRPVQGWSEKDARSHTTMPFELHTDASFERTPPRFVAMAVLRSDRCGGGELSVIKIADAVATLRADEVDTLLTACPRWIVPHEFFKAGVEEVRAPVLMSRTRARFRCDKLCTEHMEVEEARKFRDAFASFRAELERRSVSQTMVVPEQTVIIVDNQRFAHARSNVYDMKRHLLRVRFDLPHVSLDN